MRRPAVAERGAAVGGAWRGLGACGTLACWSVGPERPGRQGMSVAGGAAVCRCTSWWSSAMVAGSTGVWSVV